MVEGVPVEGACGKPFSLRSVYVCPPACTVRVINTWLFLTGIITPTTVTAAPALTDLSLIHIFTRGDSVSKADAPVPAEEIVGEIVAIIRRGRRVALELTLGRRMVAWVLRRSNFSTRVLLHFGRMAWAR